jgi:sugar/nucleoside kinase (ribokinase family)
MHADTPIDYLIIGHVCRDLTAGGEERVGGSVAYAGRTAAILGARTAVVTSAAPDYDLDAALPGLPTHLRPAAETTTFRNVETPSGRRQTLLRRAQRLRGEDVPVAWRRAAIVHLAPVADEVDPALITLFSNSLVGLTPQGWLRQWDDAGRVSATSWPAAAATLPLAAVTVLSETDPPDADALARYRRWARLLVLTRGDGGCTVYLDDEERDLPAPQVTAVNATGAGDIFAAAFLMRLLQTAGNPWEAARFGNELAAHSVAAETLDEKMERIQRVYAERYK